MLSTAAATTAQACGGIGKEMLAASSEQRMQLKLRDAPTLLTNSLIHRFYYCISFMFSKLSVELKTYSTA